MVVKAEAYTMICRLEVEENCCIPIPSADVWEPEEPELHKF